MTIDLDALFDALVNHMSDESTIELFRLARLGQRAEELAHEKCDTCGTELFACRLTRCPKCCPDLDDDYDH